MKSFGIDLAQSAQGVTGSALTRLPYVLLVVLVGVTGYVQQVITNKQQGPPATAQAAQMQRTMKYLPVFFAFISFNIQAAVVLYWIVGNLWIIVQGQILRKLNPPEIATAAVDAKPVPAAVEAVSDSKQAPKQDSKQASRAGGNATRTASNGAAGKNGSRKGGLAKGDPVSGRSTTRTTSSGSEGKTPSSAGAPTKQSAIAAAKQAAREGRSKRTGSPDEQNKGR